MKDRNKAKTIIFTLGLIFIASAFAVSFLPLNTHTKLSKITESALPEGVHIPININTADKYSLCLLEGIGETLAENIIAYREENGGFKTKEEILNVHKIGEKTFEQIKNYICVD